MKRTQLVDSLTQIKTLAEECLQALGEKSRNAPPRPKETQKGGRKNTLPDRILQLRDNGFFAQPKTAQETHAKLSPTYSCELDRVMMALLRLKERRMLRKTSKFVNEKKQGAYVW